MNFAAVTIPPVFTTQPFFTSFLTLEHASSEPAALAGGPTEIATAQAFPSTADPRTESGWSAKGLLDDDADGVEDEDDEDDLEDDEDDLEDDDELDDDEDVEDEDELEDEDDDLDALDDDDDDLEDDEDEDDE